MTEFQLIEKFFSYKNHRKRSDVLLGMGDDCALVKIPSKQELAISTDTLISGVHFPKNTAPYDIGYKALAVNLSDLAAMGADPTWVTLALTLPKANEKWLKEFSKGFFALINKYGLQLIGGDTTHGPLSITVQVFGLVKASKALRRSGAKAGDAIYVTGTLGDAGLALRHLQGKIKLDKKTQAEVLMRLNRPQPRIIEGMAAKDYARSAIDISDGLAADLGHILAASNVGASICVDDLPLSSALTKNVKHKLAIDLALNAGDDYELCFTVPTVQEAGFKKALESINGHSACIGTIEKKPGLRLHHKDGSVYRGSIAGYKHF